MTAQMREKFFTFNLGHLLTLVAILASGAGLYSASARSDERQAARLDFIDVKLADHSSTLKLHAEIIANIDKIGTTKSTQSLASDSDRIAIIQRAVAEHEITIRQLGIMANDIGWIKAELLRRKQSND